MIESNLMNMRTAGQWNEMYSDPAFPLIMGEPLPYRMGYEWLRDCEKIEDWGCGPGFFGTLCKPDQWFGIDGSNSPKAKLVQDLTKHKSKTPGLWSRNMLEHVPQWQAILRNMLASFTERMALCTFVPFCDRPHFSHNAASRTIPGGDYELIARGVQPNGAVLVRVESGGQVVFALPEKIIIRMFEEAKCSWKVDRNIETNSQFGYETIFYLWREGFGPKPSEWVSHLRPFEGYEW